MMGTISQAQRGNFMKMQYFLQDGLLRVLVGSTTIAEPDTHSTGETSSNPSEGWDHSLSLSHST